MLDTPEIIAEHFIRHESGLLVSDRGRIYGDRLRTFRAKARKDGYCQIHAKGDRFYYLHRLVYEAHRGPIPAGLEINHKDLNKQNNALDNLEAVTHAENIRHAIRLKRGRKP